MPSDGAISNVSGDVILEYIRQYQTQKRVVDEANGVLRSIVKRAKSDGINTTQMIAVVGATKLDPEVAVQNLRDLIRYGTLKRLPFTTDQLFAGWDARVTDKTLTDDALWDSEDAGYKAGRAGTPIEDCPFPQGSELAQRWTTYWHRGQASRAAEMPGGEGIAASRGPRKRASTGSSENLPAVQEPRRKRGRPPKNRAAAPAGPDDGNEPQMAAA